MSKKTSYLNDLIPTCLGFKNSDSPNGLPLVFDFINNGHHIFNGREIMCSSQGTLSLGISLLVALSNKKTWACVSHILAPWFRK